MGNNVQGEESDFEFMFTEEVKEDKEKEAEKLKGRKSYFEFCVMKPELNNIAKLLLSKGYSISRAFKDAFKVGNYQQLFLLLNNMDKDSVIKAVNIKDEAGRGIFHSLSKAPKLTAFDEICVALIENYNLDPNERDNDGNSPIMLACQQGKLRLVKALELVNCSIKDTNYDGENTINMMLKGKRIKNYDRELLKYLITKGVNFSNLYEEAEYAEVKAKDKIKNSDDEGVNKDSTYKCTPLIHLLRTELLEVWDKGELIDDIFEQDFQRIDPNQTDSDGKDIFMHMAISNEFDLSKYVISCISQNFASTKKQTIDIHKKEEIVEEIKKENLKNKKGQGIQDDKNKKQQTFKREQEELILTNKYEIAQQEQLENLRNKTEGIDEIKNSNSDQEME